MACSEGEKKLVLEPCLGIGGEGSQSRDWLWLCSKESIMMSMSERSPAPWDNWKEILVAFNFY